MPNLPEQKITMKLIDNLILLSLEKKRNYNAKPSAKKEQNLTLKFLLLAVFWRQQILWHFFFFAHQFLIADLQNKIPDLKVSLN